MRFKYLGVAAAIVTAAAFSLTGTVGASAATQAAGPAFVQVVAAQPQTNQITVTVRYTKAQAAGDTNVLAIGWGDVTSNIAKVSDSSGNTYAVAAPTVHGSVQSQAIYYAPNIKAAAAGANTVTVTFNTAAAYVDLRASEYSGLDATAPFDVAASATGSASTAASPSVTTSYSSELIFGAGDTSGVFSAAGAGFTKRIITKPDSDITEDKTVSAIGSYNATGKQSGAWIMQVVAFKAAGGAPDTTPPSVPTGLSATAVSQSQVNLSWIASTNNVGVTGYKVYRNGTQVGTTTTTSYQDTGLTAGTTYSYTVAAYDAAGNVSAQSTAASATTQAPDTTPPSVPAGLSATAVSSTQINLSWTASTDNVGVTGYDVFRNGTQVGTTTTTSYQDTGLTAGTTYSYTVAAYDAAGNVSAQSTAASATTQAPDTTPPSVPTGLSATAVSSTQINLSWTASTDNVGVTGYDVFRNGTQVGTTTTTSYQDTGLTAGTTYSYTVAAYDAAGNVSAQSTAASATTQAPDTTPPSVPAGLTATAVSSTQINLSWTASTDNVGVTGYDVFRNGTQVGTTTTTSYQDTGLTAGTTYSYTVAAYDAAGNVSAQSTAASATTTTTVAFVQADDTGTINGNTTSISSGKSNQVLAHNTGVGHSVVLMIQTLTNPGTETDTVTSVTSGMGTFQFVNSYNDGADYEIWVCTDTTGAANTVTVTTPTNAWDAFAVEFNAPATGYVNGGGQVFDPPYLGNQSWTVSPGAAGNVAVVGVDTDDAYNTGPAAPWTYYNSGYWSFFNGTSAAWQVAPSSAPLTATWQTDGGESSSQGVVLEY